MTDCVRALTAYAFELRINTVAIHCAEGNNKSRAMPQRLGFTESGIIKDGENLYGITHDTVIYSLDPGEREIYGYGALLQRYTDILD